MKNQFLFNNSKNIKNIDFLKQIFFKMTQNLLEKKFLRKFRHLLCNYDETPKNRL